MATRKDTPIRRSTNSAVARHIARCDAQLGGLLNRKDADGWTRTIKHSAKLTVLAKMGAPSVRLRNLMKGFAIPDLTPRPTASSG
jgi:hypothetical protein